MGTTPRHGARSIARRRYLTAQLKMSPNHTHAPAPTPDWPTVVVYGTTLASALIARGIGWHDFALLLAGSLVPLHRVADRLRANRDGGGWVG